MSSSTTTPYYQSVDTFASVSGLQNIKQIAFPLSFAQMAIAAEVIGDYLAAAAAAIGSYSAYQLPGPGRDILYPASIAIQAAFVLAFVFVILLDREGIYRMGSGMLRISETERTLRVSVFCLLLAVPVSIFAAHLLPRALLATAFLALPCAVLLEKQMLFSMISRLHARGLGVRKAIIVGAGDTGKRVFSVLLRSRKLGINPVVFVDDDVRHSGKSVSPLSYHHGHNAPIVPGPVTPALIAEYQADLIIVAAPSLDHGKQYAITTAAKSSRVTVAFVRGDSINQEDRVSYINIDGMMLESVGTPPPRFAYEIAKRSLDLAVSLAALLVLSPVFAAIAFAVRLDSKGPVIFKQQRVGKNGRMFWMFKFRTMRLDTPAYAASPTSCHDARITRTGRFLRRASLDELPQILNVIRGEMSLVGPRPEMPFIVDQYEPHMRVRLSVVPGITGLWQLSADRAFPIHENLQYDLYYIRNRGFFMDVAVLLHTLLFAVKGI